ncbi:uncharacterized protein LOC129584436 isoform X2 [Paramacrobiotus metropolitanus]|uniref:uncharacterized protein LOC129584436 isoform X2 n=1 Tax=Paramacrobiotus metropolitanus TaxID=2943436 RepID=UPI002446397A|nr:uncharacterized protein LOC129584436 isoform X2 [Paramacrobiotus metropolitanus]
MITLRILPFLLLGIFKVPGISASGVLHVEVLSYTSPGASRIRPSSLCCDAGDSAEPACSAPCDIFVSICISKENLKSRFPKGLTDADSIDCGDGKLIDARLPSPFGYPDGARVPANLHFKSAFDGRWAGYQNIRLQLRRGDKNGNTESVDRFSVNYFKTDAFDEGSYTGKVFTASGIRPNSTSKLEVRVAAVCDYTSSRSVAPYCENAPCSPTDDCTGHYTCHPATGKKVCLNGWTGTKCNERLALLPACAKDHQCANGAPCIVNGTSPSDYYCCCSVGWHGPHCDKPAGIDFARLRVKTTSLDDEFNSLSDAVDDEFLPADLVIRPQIRKVRQAPPNPTIRVGVQVPETAGRVLLVPTVNATAPGFVGHRPLFNINAQTDPQIFSSMQLINMVSPVDGALGVHKVAIMNAPKSIQDLEAVLQTAWWNANFEAQGLSQSAVTVKILQFRDYGLFSDQGIPVIEATYAVGLNRSIVPATFDTSTVRLPDIQGLTRALQTRDLQLCDCDVYEGRYLHLVGIVSVGSNATQYQQAMQAVWLSVGPELRCGNCQVSVRFARTVITVGTAGVRLTTIPYVVLLNNKVWATQTFVNMQLDPSAVETALAAVGQPVQVYHGTQLPVYAALAFVNYLNANIHFQDIPAVQRSLQSYLDARMPRPPVLATVWNLEPFLDPTANVITQSSYFLSLPNGEVMDPRLFYAPPIIDILSRQSEGNVSTFTGETLGIHPVYLYGDINANLLRSVAEILKMTYAEQNTGQVNPDDVQVAVVSMDNGLVQALPPQSGMTRVTELHVSAMVGGVDPDRKPNLTPFHQMLTAPDSQNVLDTRLTAFDTKVCRNCQFRKLRTLNLLQVDPTTASVADAQAIMDKLFSAWIAANPESPWLPMNLMLAGRDDSLANENGTLVSQLLYSVGYPLPNFNWYIPRDPSNDNLERQLALVKAVPFFGTPILPQRISLNKHMGAADQTLFATAAMRAWAEDKDDLRLCLQPDANCFIAVADAENPAVNNVNGNPQYLYKYFILVNDKVYTPTSPLSQSQLIKLRNTMDATSGTGAGGAVVVIAPPAGSNITIAVTQAPTTTTTTPAVPATLPGGAAAPPPLNFTHSLNMVVGTERQKAKVLDAVKNVWSMALGPNVTNVRLIPVSDQPGFPDPYTADGLPIRTVVYLVQWTPVGTYNIQNAVSLFNQLLPAANIREIQLANPGGSTPAPPSAFVVDFGKSPVNQSVAVVPIIVPPAPAAQNQSVGPQAVVPILGRSPGPNLNATTTTAASVGPAAPILIIPAASTATTAAPNVIKGPFVIHDTLAITADTKRQRDRILEDQVKPQWVQALGPGVPRFNLIVKGDQTYSTPSAPEGKTPAGNSIRQINYDIAGVSGAPIDTTAALNKFHELAGQAGLHDVWAIPDQYGTMVLASTIPKATTTTVASAVGPAVAVIIPAGPVATTAKVPTTRRPVVAHGDFSLPDVIAITADTRRQRDRILEDEIKPVWRETFGKNVSDGFKFTVKGDSTFNPPSTPEGKSIRQIAYTVDGMSTVDLNFNEAADQFHVLALNAGLPSLWAVPDPYGNWILASSVPKKTTTTAAPTTTTANATGLAVIPIVIPGSGESQPTPAPTEAPVLVPEGTTRPPLIVPPGPFTIQDVVGVVAETKHQRDQAFATAIQPAWQAALAPVTQFNLQPITDTAYTTATQDNVNGVRLVGYVVNGVADAPFDTNAALERFHDLIGGAKPPGVYAIQNKYGNLVEVASLPAPAATTTPAGILPVFIVPGQNNQTAVVTPNGTVILPAQPATAILPFEPRASGSVLLKSYADTDAPAIQDTLDQLWAGALGAPAESIKIAQLNSSGPTGNTTADGAPIYSYNYLLLALPNVTANVSDAFPAFIQMLTNGDLQVNPEAPANITEQVNKNDTAILGVLQSLQPVTTVAPRTSTVAPGPAVVSVLSFKESQDVIIPDASAAQPFMDGLRHLWAQAANVEDPAVQIGSPKLTKSDPPRVAPNGVPIQNLVYDVTIQNNSDPVNVIRARERALAPKSSIAGMLFFGSTLAANTTNTSTATIVPIPVPLPAGATTAAPVVATTLAQQALPPAPPVYYHDLDAHIANMDVVNQLQNDLGVLWSQAYGVPQGNAQVVVQGMQPVGVDENQRPISRVQYTVQAPKNETPEIIDTFTKLLLNSPIKDILVVPSNPAPPAGKTSHSVEIAVSNPQELDAVYSGLRNSWASTLGLDQQPGAVTVALTALLPENVATQNGVRVQNVTYDLTVPPNVAVGPEQEQAFMQALLASPARPYLFVRGEPVPATTTAPNGSVFVVPVPVPVPSGPAPIALTDSIILTPTSRGATANIMVPVKQAWVTALGPSASDVQLTIKSDRPYSQPTTEEGKPIRNITYDVTGVSSTGPVDEYAVKEKVRQLLATKPVDNVFLVPPLGERPATVATVAPETTTNASVPIVPVVLTTAPAETTLAPGETATTANATGLAVIPVVVPGTGAEATTAAPVTAMKFLQLRRPVKAGDEAEIAALIAAAWAEANNRSPNDIQVNVTNIAPTVDEKGQPSSNITYLLTSPTALVVPEGPAMTRVLAQKNWPVCDQCFMVPEQKVFMTMPDPHHIDPTEIRKGLNQGVTLANPDIDSTRLQVGFPQSSPPKATELVSEDQKRLLQVNYFVAAINNQNQLMGALPPKVDQVQAQFPDRTVYAEGDARLREPVILHIQRRDDAWQPEYNNPDQVRKNIREELERIGDKAVKNVAAQRNLPCNDCTGKVLDVMDLYGRFGRHFLKVIIYPENIGNGYPDASVIADIKKEAEGLINNSKQPITVSPESDRATMATDPEKVYFRDYRGRPTIYDIRNKESEFLQPWLNINPDCKPVGKVDCGLHALMLSAETRQAISDGSKVTRVYYIVEAKSPYVHYPIPRDINTPIPSQRLRSIVMPNSSHAAHNLAERHAKHARSVMTREAHRFRRQTGDEAPPTGGEAATPVQGAAAAVPATPAPETVAQPVQAAPQPIQPVPPQVDTPAQPVAAVVQPVDAVVQQPAANVAPADNANVQLTNSTAAQTPIQLYCYMKNNGTFIPYFSETVLALKDDSQGAGSATNAPAVPAAAAAPTTAAPNAGSEDDASLRIGAPQCTDCVCGIPAYKILLKGHVPKDQVANVTRDIGRAWRDTHGAILKDEAGIDLDKWVPYVVEQEPNYDYRDAKYGNLTYLTYTILVANGTTDDLLIPDLTQEQLAAYGANATYPPCNDCHPLMDYVAFVGGLPTDNGTNSVVAKALADTWSDGNREAVKVAGSPFTVDPNYSLTGGYSAKIGNASIPVQRLDYTVAVPPNTTWNMLDWTVIGLPDLETFNSHFRSDVSPNATVYPYETVTATRAASTEPEYRLTTTPNWLPAAIIVPLFGAILMVLIIVCLITRASRIFRSKKTVVITDPAMIQTMHPNDSPFKEGNGKSNHGFDDFHGGVRQDISKV